MPTNTDLVKDLPADFETFGQAVDTQLKNLSPGTTAGDVDYYTSSTAKARVAIGTAGQVLTVNSGATAPEWATISAGGMTLLSTTTLSGATTTISSISQAYNSLFFVMYGVTAAGNGNMRVQPNGSSSTSTMVHARGESAAGSSTAQSIATNLDFSTVGWDGTNSDNVVSVRIDNYTSSSNFKSVNMFGSYRNSSGNTSVFVSGGAIVSNTAITSLVFSQAGGNLSAGTVLLYGVK
jgi:hypothetical protein